MESVAAASRVPSPPARLRRAPARVPTIAPILLPLTGTTPALAPSELWGAWSWELGIVLPLALTGILYAIGVAALWRRGTGRGIRRWEAAAFGAGWLVLAAALVSPLHRLGEVLFSAHMAQHELIMAVAAPLLVLGRPLIPFLWALPPRWRRVAGAIGRSRWVRSAWRTATEPTVAWSVHAAALWVWHAPPLFERTLDSHLAHSLQHASFLGSALLFWWALVRSRRRRMGFGGAVLYTFTTAAHTGALGALLTFAPTLWYPLYSGTTAPWGLTPLEDQQLAGLIMWIPAGIAYLLAALLFSAQWLRDSEWRAIQRERGALLGQS